MRGFSKHLFVFLSLAVLASQGRATPARADLDVHLLGSGSSSSVSDSGSRYSASGWAIGYGALLSGRVNPYWSYRFGGIVIGRKTAFSTMPERQTLVLPLLAGYRLAPGVRAEFGGYYDYAFSSVSGFRKSTYGAMAGISADLPLIPGVGVLLGGHYTYAIGGLAVDASRKTAYNDIVITAGFRLGTTR